MIDKIREQTDIVELVGGYVPLRKVGRNHRGLCPFHAEKSPSFYVNQERQSYHCFGCGAGGTAISFVMAIEKIEFPEAVRQLGKRLGIAVETEAGAGRNAALYDACEMAAAHFEVELARAPAARAYVESRQLRQETVKRFRLGFAPGGNRLRAEAGRRGLSHDVLVRAGLLAQREAGVSDYFFGRVMFPVFSVSGRVVGFSGRVMEDKEPKYLNSPDTDVFHKGELLYGFFQAKGYIRSEVPIVVEGNFDLLSLADRGLNNVVAGLGTALTASQASLLRRYNARAVLCYDGDAAGRKACRRALDVLLAAGIDPQVASLPGGSDPDSYVRGSGRDSFASLVAGAVDFVDALLADAVVGTVPQKRQALGELMGLLNRIGDETTRELYAEKIAGRFRVDKARLLRRPGETTVVRVRSPSRALEEKLVAAAVQSAELASIAAEAGLSETLSDGRLRRIAQFVEQHCREPGFGAGMVMDGIDDDESRRRVAAWTLVEDRVPAVDFRERVRAFRSAWLRAEVLAATRAGDSERAESLSLEQARLRQEIVRERSSRQ